MSGIMRKLTVMLVKRSTAILALSALAILTLAVCCTSTPLATEQHGCCKGRCVSMSVVVPLVAMIPTLAAPWFALELQPDVSAVSVPSLSGARAHFFAPILTIQLRI